MQSTNYCHGSKIYLLELHCPIGWWDIAHPHSKKRYGVSMPHWIKSTGKTCRDWGGTWQDWAWPVGSVESARDLSARVGAILSRLPIHYKLRMTWCAR